MEPQIEKIDTSKLTIEQAEALSEQIGSKVRQICDEAVEKANSILNPYGMNSKIHIIINGLDQEPESKKKAPTKRARKPKSAKS